MTDERNQREQNLRETLARINVWDPPVEYYALTLTATEDGRPLWSSYSHFVGRSERFRGWERRVASIVDPTNMTSLWEGVGQSWVAVHERVQLYLWLRLGGNALVEAELARRWLPQQVAVREVAPNGPIGFLNSDSLTAAQRQRRPTRGVGKRIARRDEGVSCRCGRSDVPLTKHHVLHYSEGGLTQENNLVSLCDACHDEVHAAGTWYPEPPLVGVLLSHEARRLHEDYDVAVRRHRVLATRIASRSRAVA